MSSAQAALTSASWASVEGAPAPLGVTYLPGEKAYNFALYSKYATSVTLLLYAQNDPVTPVDTYSFVLPQNKTGRVWHCRLSEARVRNAAYYAYQVDGPSQA